MALENREQPITDAPLIGEKRGDLDQLVDHVKENPLLYILGTLFVFVCLIVGGIYGVVQSGKDRNIRTEYAAALQDPDPATVAANLDALADQAGAWTPEVRYMLGEYSLRAQALAKAEDEFTKVVDEYPGSEFAARAMDGLGYIHENREDYEKAREAYLKLAGNSAWADTMAAKLVHGKIARIHEKLEHFKEAKAAYETQIEVFPGTETEPTNARMQAEAALERLRESHPDLFPESEITSTPEAALPDAPAAGVVEITGDDTPAEAPEAEATP